MKTVEDRLNELIEQKERAIEALKVQVAQLTDERTLADVMWCLPHKLHLAQTLPVPRLEIVLSEAEGEYKNYWYYRLVYRHFLGHIMAVPLGETSSSSSGSRTWPNRTKDGKFEMPLRDGMHIQSDMLELNLPGFVVYKDEAQAVHPCEDIVDKHMRRRAALDG